jgi:FkbM family methyltransferase
LYLRFGLNRPWLGHLFLIGDEVENLSRDDVVAVYHLLLGREPENDEVISNNLQLPSIRNLISNFMGSDEYLQRQRANPFYVYNSSIDILKIIRSYENPARIAKENHVVNFMGVAMNLKFMPFFAGREAWVEDAPIPANWHADMAEFGAALRAVDLARGQFRMIELGCGWGCWMNITGVAAKSRGLDIRVIGLEGDQGHIEFAREALATNGIAPSEYRLLRGIAGAKRGSALFPKQDRPGDSWGSDPVFDNASPAWETAWSSGMYDELPVISLDEVIAEEARIDLLHMDIQGGEGDLIHDSLETLSAKVAYMLVGTHSRVLEGAIVSNLLAAGWILEVERPAVIVLSDAGPTTVVDGVQAWRNPRMFGAQ